MVDVKQFLFATNHVSLLTFHLSLPHLSLLPNLLRIPDPDLRNATVHFDPAGNANLTVQIMGFRQYRPLQAVFAPYNRCKYLIGMGPAKVQERGLSANLGYIVRRFHPAADFHYLAGMVHGYGRVDGGFGRGHAILWPEDPRKQQRGDHQKQNDGKKPFYVFSEFFHDITNIARLPENPEGYKGSKFQLILVLCKTFGLDAR